ncbi:MAG TPA: VPDSG-CTERM sorting domain-containing protein [Verrucomicrobiae bacterium]
MKSKNLMLGLAFAGMLAMSASVAKADAFMELISGSTTIDVTGAIMTHGANYYGVAGNGALFVGSVGSWSVDIASGAESGAFNVTLTDNINGNTTQTHGLEVVYSSGPYNLGSPGFYTFGASDAGGNTLTATISGYYNATAMYNGSGLADLATYEASSTLMGKWTLPTTIAQSQQNVDFPINGTADYITEVMLFGGTTGSIPPQRVAMQATASFTPFVPDGGTTAAMVGSALLGLVMFRSKFGAKA